MTGTTALARLAAALAFTCMTVVVTTPASAQRYGWDYGFARHYSYPMAPRANYYGAYYGAASPSYAYDPYTYAYARVPYAYGYADEYAQPYAYGSADAYAQPYAYGYANEYGYPYGYLSAYGCGPFNRHCPW